MKTILTLVLAVLAGLLRAQTPPPAMSPPNVIIKAPEVTKPPETFFKMMEERLSNPRGRGPRIDSMADEMAVYRNFYKKYIDVKGMPVAAHGDVADLALQRTYEIVTSMLAGRPDILSAMVSNQTYLIVIGKNQVYTDMPEYRRHPNPVFQNERVRGTGGNPTSFGEENLLCLPIDRYDDESIAVHEFCHTIDSTLRRIEPDWENRKRNAYQNALDKGLYFETYAAGNPAEYWAEIAQAYFDCNRINNWNHGPIGTREQLKTFDPVGYELCRSVFNFTSNQDWRYQWLQRLPMISAPPTTSAFKDIDPWYTKFTWAREFTVLGRGASDESMLKANHIIRRMFAWRHDILKALMAEDLKLVVLGSGESLADLPEYKKLLDKKKIDHTLRFLTYQPAMKILVVSQENIDAGGVQLIRIFADALYKVVGTRPVIKDYRGNQQYELRVKRLDTQFDEQVTRLFEKAKESDKWKGTSSREDKFNYWAAGVLAYFDATRHEPAPNDFRSPIDTREKLKEYDPGLYDLVNETMAFEGKVDWRLANN